MNVADFDTATRHLSREQLAAWLDSFASGALLEGHREVGGAVAVIAADGSFVSAADGAVVIARPGSTVTAWAGARVYARSGATVRIGAGSSCHVDGDSRVEAGGTFGVELPNSSVVISAWNGAYVDITSGSIYADDASLMVREGVLVAGLGPNRIEQSESRGSSIRGGGTAAFSDILDDLRDSAAENVTRQSRAVYPAQPRPGQSREEWLALLIERVTATTKRVRRWPRGGVSGPHEALAPVLRELAIPPTIAVYDLPLATGDAFAAIVAR